VKGRQPNIGQDQSKIFNIITAKCWTGRMQNIGQDGGIQSGQDFRTHAFDGAKIE
jgi:hypothetical protein